jgi:hypothetical protein
MYKVLLLSILYMYVIMDKKLQTFIGIMAFYAILAFVVFPLAFYYLVNNSLMSAGNGFVVGSLVSIVLWYTFGRNLI